MSTIEFCKQKLEAAGWNVLQIVYERPKSGFKCIDGGYICELEADDDDYDVLQNIQIEKGLFGTIHGSGLIMALYKDDFIKLVNKIPNKKAC